jgi:hypothetical protein
MLKLHEQGQALLPASAGGQVIFGLDRIKNIVVKFPGTLLAAVGLVLVQDFGQVTFPVLAAVGQVIKGFCLNGSNFRRRSSRTAITVGRAGGEKNRYYEYEYPNFFHVLNHSYISITL